MAILSPSPKLQFFDANGNPLVGGKLYSYTAGTTSPLATYTDSTNTSANTNPIILDSRGEASVWLGSSAYKLVLYSATDVLIWSVDNVTAASSDTLANLAASGGSSLIGYTQGGTGAVPTTVQTKLRESVSVKDFGAVGDGIANDTAAIQAAVNASMASTTIGELFFPYGNYVINAPITIPTRTGQYNAVALKISGSAIGGNAVNGNANPRGAVLTAGASFSGAFMLGFSANNPSPGTDGTQLEIEGITLNAASRAAKCIYINQPVNVTLTRVTTLRATNINIDISGATEKGYSVNLRDIYIYGGSPAHIPTPSNYGIYSTARFALFDRVVIDGCKTGIASSGDAVTLNVCHIEGQATCVDLTTTGQGLCRVHGNLLNPYAAGESGWPASGVAITLKGIGPGAGLENFITNNVMTSLTGAAPVGIFFDESYKAVISGNQINATTCFSINGSAASDRLWSVRDNIMSGTTTIAYNVTGGNLQYSRGNVFNGTRTPVFTGNTSYIQQDFKVDFLLAGTSRFEGLPIVSVSTAATTIKSFTNPNGPLLLQVAGETGAAGFFDLIMYAFGSVAVVSSNTGYGAPAARTYTRVSGDIKLTMASGTYSVRVQSVEWQG